jgi:putative methionine-R-sulfoxide reductase with GAF domain
MSDTADLRDALDGLSSVLTAYQPLESTLTQIAEFAVQAIPHADGAGLTLLRGEKSQTVVASSPFVQAIDDVQYSIGEGPCLTAVAGRRTVVSGSLGGDPQWPRFGPRIGRMGVHSALSLPLLLGDRVIGAMNVYSHAKEAFDAGAARLGEQFAAPAAVSVHNAAVLTQTQETVEHLTAALTTRATIDQALGIIMSRTGADPDEAFERLRVMSQNGKIKVSELAQNLVNEAIARSRTPGDPGVAFGRIRSSIPFPLGKQRPGLAVVPVSAPGSSGGQPSFSRLRSLTHCR